ncbi:hypothetical protein B0H17DRAFT_1124917 [Mycena rosella]|uniref:Uncharacterized protein n=1 Tax=Mycena rosella TaxID=1033263 RepID=A0AAD7GYZ1_MYCRO|nr:hypothetical protein B0H17DRAFT_1124917 [Mycena rosella]
MENAGESNQVKHANNFVHQFDSAHILPGDASLIDPHTAFVVQSLPSDMAAPEDADGDFKGAAGAVSVDLRRRATTLAPLLFQLIILGLYLRRTPADDPQIYFLARELTRKELQHLSVDDSFYAHKRGKIIHHMTVPEIVLQTPETSAKGENIPRNWCKIGTSVTKAAGARIPRSFRLATAYNCEGEEYA